MVVITSLLKLLFDFSCIGDTIRTHEEVQLSLVWRIFSRTLKFIRIHFTILYHNSYQKHWEIQTTFLLSDTPCCLWNEWTVQYVFELIVYCQQVYSPWGWIMTGFYWSLLPLCWLSCLPKYWQLDTRADSASLVHFVVCTSCLLNSEFLLLK